MVRNIKFKALRVFQAYTKLKLRNRFCGFLLPLWKNAVSEQENILFT